MPETQPVVSVITIFLNGAAFLEEAIASVIEQQFEDWELLLVDDGSTDASPDIAQRYSKLYPRQIKCLQHPRNENRGMSASRNLGIAEARGELVALLDADDVWLPEKLATQVEQLRSNPRAAMVYDSTRVWRSWSTPPGSDRMRRLGVPADTLVEPPEMIPLFLDTSAETPGTCSFLARLDAVKAIGGFEQSFRGLYEDQVFLFKMCLRYPVYISAGVTSLYRRHPESCCSTAKESGEYKPGRPHAAELAFLQWLERYVASERIGDPAITTGLRRALRPYRSSAWRGAQAAKRALARRIRRVLERGDR